MTSLLPRSTRASARSTLDESDVAHRRPLVLLAVLGGATAAASTLLVCLTVGVLGWFLSDAGAHGTSSDGLRMGALTWLVAHGSGIRIGGVLVTAIPLGLTLLAGWTIWRIGHRVGDSVSGHGPDADRIADGERDWTVALTVFAFAAGYLAVAVVTCLLAGTPETAPSSSRVVGWSLLLCLLVAAPAVAIGSGRAAIWLAFVPLQVRAGGYIAGRILIVFLAVATLWLLGALAVDFGAALNVASELNADASGTTVFTLLSTGVLPNAVVFSGSYLLGPGFAIGAQTLVSPTAVVLGPLPLFPLLAALPDNGPTALWTAYLMSLPLLVAAVATARAQRRLPTLRWDEGALRGCVGGVLAGVIFGALAGLAGGAVGPGRMRTVEPFAFDVLVHAITAFGIGGLLGGLAMTWWQRRTAQRAARAD